MVNKFAICCSGVILGLSTFLSGCAGKTPHPVQVYQPDDKYLSCHDIREQINGNHNEMYRLYPKTKKTGKNVALGVTGAFFIVPLFFMDFSDAEKVEIQAFQRRDEHLHRLASRKGCTKVPPRIKVTHKKPRK